MNDYYRLIGMKSNVIQGVKIYKTSEEIKKNIGSYYCVIMAEDCVTLSDGTYFYPYIDVFPINAESNYNIVRKIDIGYRETLDCIRRSNWRRKDTNSSKYEINKGLLNLNIRNRFKYNKYANMSYTFADYFHPKINQSKTKIINKEKFNEYILIEFEGYKFWCFKEYNAILTKFYGKWDDLPPFYTQEPTHGV